VKYKSFPAVDGVSFEVCDGEAVALLGANGAGKSTLMRAISGLLPVHSGKIIFKDNEIQNMAPENRFKSGIVLVPEGRHVIPGLSTWDNLLLGGASRLDKPSMAKLKDEVNAVVEIFPGLKKVIRRSAWTLSGGEQQMCAIGRAMMGKPKILLLDEPSQGLAPVIVQELFSQIQKINSQGITVLLVEQNAHLSMQVCQRVYVMQLGKIVYENTSEKAMNDDNLINSYLGTD
jgi:branched-chain amino acid transport system ATP-binding protein